MADYNDNMTVGEAAKAIEARKVRKKKPKAKTKEKDGKAGFMEVITEPFRKIEKAMKKRTGGKSMREKHYPKRKKK